MRDALPPLLAGLAAGAVMTRGGLCFNRAIRQAVFERRDKVLRAFAFAVSLQLLLLPLLVALGVDPLERNADRGGLPLLPVAQLAGGLAFGAGMALAGGCVTGMLWKAGTGSLALAIAIVGFAIGELLIRDTSLIATLDDASRPAERSLAGLLDVGYEPLAIVLGLAALLALGAKGPRGVRWGLPLGVVAAAAWIAADAAGYGYGLGFVGAAEGTKDAIADGTSLPFQLYLAVGVVAGAAAVGRRKLVTPDAKRAAIALAGGLLMGAGGSVAHGCNIGHGVTGVPLLSLGSMLATAAMVAGAAAVLRFRRPRRRLLPR